MRYRILLAACAYLSISASASAHTSVGGSGAPDDPNADCLRWEVVPLTASDAAVVDGAAADAGRADGGSSGLTVLRCVEHATMFGCACALAQPEKARARAAMGFAAALAVLVAGVRRPRRRRQRGDR